MQYSTLITYTLRTSALAVLVLSSSSQAFTIPSTWDALKLELKADAIPTNNNNNNDNLDPSLPTFYRDKNCICAACESVWLALETKCVRYNTVLVDIDGNDSNSNDNDDLTIPRITWPANDDDNTNTNTPSNNKNNNINDPIQLLEQIQKRYPQTPPNFYPSLSSAVDASRCNILRLPGVMPRNADAALQSLAPYLFRVDGTLVKQSSHAVSLEEIEEMQEEYYLGDFLCGREITAADMIWGPYLERYAVQLPLVFPKKGRLNPRNRNVYPEVENWYRVMEGSVPEYVCRVMGDERHWRRCLEVAVEIHNERVVDEEERVDLVDVLEEQERGWWMKTKRFERNDVEKIWNDYSSKRSWVASTAGGEVSLFLWRNREMIVDAAVAAMGEEFGDNDGADEALREVAQVLIEWNSAEETSTNQCLSERGLKMALFVAEEMIQVPRDIGMIPSSVLWDVIRSSNVKEGEIANVNVEEQTKVAMS